MSSYHCLFREALVIILTLAYSPCLCCPHPVLHNIFQGLSFIFLSPDSPLVSVVKLWNNVVIHNINFILDSGTDFVTMALYVKPGSVTSFDGESIHLNSPELYKSLWSEFLCLGNYFLRVFYQGVVSIAWIVFR